MSRNAFGASCPSRTILMTPPFSTTKMRPLPSLALATATGASRPLDDRLETDRQAGRVERSRRGRRRGRRPARTMAPTVRLSRLIPVGRRRRGPGARRLRLGAHAAPGEGGDQQRGRKRDERGSSDSSYVSHADRTVPGWYAPAMDAHELADINARRVAGRPALPRVHHRPGPERRAVRSRAGRAGPPAAAHGGRGLLRRARPRPHHRRRRGPGRADRLDRLRRCGRSPSLPRHHRRARRCSSRSARRRARGPSERPRLRPRPRTRAPVRRRAPRRRGGRRRRRRARPRRTAPAARPTRRGRRVEYS